MTHTQLPFHSRLAGGLLLAALSMSACQPTDPPRAEAPPAPAAAPASATALPAPVEAPADAFFERLATLCGQAFAGRITANMPADTNDPFAGKPLVMHVRECSAEEIRIPFHVGDDRSRTWVLTRTADGLRLKHDHRHADGHPDVLTQYGGDSLVPGSRERQEFPVDAESQALFSREGRDVSNTNVWALEVQPGLRFAYELSRPHRLFRVEFNLANPVAAPPAPWGAEG